MINSFDDHFHIYKDRRIALYGAGRNTVRVIQTYRESYRFVGVIDKDTDNLGKRICGIPIIDISEIEIKADVVIICTNPAFWNIIYERIKEISLPIFLLDGKNAEMLNTNMAMDLNNEYWDTDLNRVRNEIVKHDVISFDFFDTLFVRMVLYPADVFSCVAKMAQYTYGINDFEGIRKEAREQLAIVYTIDELYQKIIEISCEDEDDFQRIKEYEIEFEKRILKPRKDILDLFCQIQLMKNKELYIISDMYLPKSFYVDVLKENNIDFTENHILVSSEYSMSKEDGSLWRLYKKEILKNQTGLHIGDNRISDFEKPMSFGIDSVQIFGIQDMLRHSNMKSVEKCVLSKHDSFILGTALTTLYNDPFKLSKTKGVVYIESLYEMGYSIFGMIIYCFMQKLFQLQKKYRKIIFCSRDGYFLMRDYLFFLSCHNIGKTNIEYLYLSRLFLGLVTINNTEDLKKYIGAPYKGNFCDFMHSRFGINVDKRTREINDMFIDTSDVTLYDGVLCYKEEINQIVDYNRECYLGYLSHLDLDDDCLFIDVGYYGHTVYYLSELLGERLKALFFIVNKEENNECVLSTDITGCFQKKEDINAHNTGIYSMGAIFDAYLTSPDGMFIGFDDSGKFKFAEKKQNQLNFEAREEINRGVCDYIREITAIIGPQEKVNPLFADSVFKKWFETGTIFGDTIRNNLYFDNEFGQSGEYQIL